jgi:predicted transposase YbfD/YdcC
VKFQACFARWMAALCPSLDGEIVAMDGKTARGSRDASCGLPAIHMVSAFVCRHGITLGQVKTDEKSNEITALPELIDTLELKGATVTVDALHCQKATAEAIVNKGAEYVFGLKGNQDTLHAEVKALFDVTEWQNYRTFADWGHTRENGGHGRIERRRCIALPCPAHTPFDGWSGMKSVVMVESMRQTANQVAAETRYFVSSLPPDSKRLAQAIRSHWEIESVPQAHGKEVQHELTDCVQVTRKMRAGPSESAFRSGLQTTPSCCGQEPSVVSVGVKASGTYPEQVRIRESNESEPSMTRRNPENCRQNQERFYLLGQACRALGYWASGDRRIGGENRIQASVWNCGNQSLRCQGRSTSGRNHEARVPKRSTGTDRPVRAMKAGNAARAKGAGQAVALGVQLATGGNG